MHLKRLFMVISICSASAATYADDLTGEQRTACEALLCLSASGKNRPAECDPSVSHYYSIKEKKWKDTVKARRNFLKLCPDANNESQNMPSLVEAIVNGAGRCDANYLNSKNIKHVEKLICPDYSRNWKWGRNYNNDECHYETVTIISNDLPGYCSTYANHGYTYQIAPTYKGDPMDGGYWVD